VAPGEYWQIKNWLGAYEYLGPAAAGHGWFRQIGDTRKTAVPLGRLGVFLGKTAHEAHAEERRLRR
jgi:hypothetical protein